jgi:hypothetical protein
MTTNYLTWNTVALPFRHTRSVWRVSIRKETQMDARLKMSGMTPMRMDFP